MTAAEQAIRAVQRQCWDEAVRLFQQAAERSVLPERRAKYRTLAQHYAGYARAELRVFLTEPRRAQLHAWQAAGLPAGLPLPRSRLNIHVGGEGVSLGALLAQGLVVQDGELYIITARAYELLALWEEYFGRAG